MRKIAILLAAYNGAEWINEQIESIISQQQVSIDLYISVDASTDSTYSICENYSRVFGNVNLLPYGEKFGGAAKNFYRLINDVDLEQYEYIALSDQDDIWYPDKLATAVSYLDAHDIYSSNVIAFWQDGRRCLLNKAQPQVEYDYYFEAAGPGCTYVMRKVFAMHFKSFMGSNDSIQNIALHDWLIYAYARANNYKWFIDSKPSMDYRQHENNQVGANNSFRSAFKRLRLIKSKWYGNEVLKISNALNSPPPLFIGGLNDGYFSKLKLIFLVSKCRRRTRDRIAFIIALLLGYM